MSKICTKCGNEKLLIDFRKRSRSLDGHSSWCKDCYKAYDKVHYVEKTDKVKKNEGTMLRRKRNQLWIKEYLESHPCIDCGDTDWWGLEFDHREQKDKSYNINILMQNASIEKIKTEVSKCDVRCLKCHRKRTIHQLGWWRIEAFN